MTLLQFTNEFMVSVTTFKSASIQHNVHFVSYVAIQREVDDQATAPCPRVLRQIVGTQYVLPSSDPLHLDIQKCVEWMGSSFLSATHQISWLCK